MSDGDGVSEKKKTPKTAIVHEFPLGKRGVHEAEQQADSGLQGADGLKVRYDSAGGSELPVGSTEAAASCSAPAVQCAAPPGQT